MKIAWFTPYNIESAIGRYSKFATAALQKYVDVDIFVLQSKQRRHESECRIVYYTLENVGEILLKYDLAVYNIGDNSLYHSGIYDVLQLYPGIIIIHDISLHNFMRGYYLLHRNQPDIFRALLEDEFGTAEAERLIRIGNNPEEYTKLDFLKYNLSKHIANNAFGVVVHSKYHKKYLREYYQGSMAIIAHLNTNDNLDKLDESVEFNGYQIGKTHILTVGNLNENKRIHSIIEVLGKNSKLAEAFDYTIVGSKSNKYYCDYLNKLIKLYKLENVVNMVGYASHEELAYYYHGADIISNLRFPAYEGASGSIVEQMAIGKCCMVSDTGVYSEIDEDCLIKINPQFEVEQITNILYDCLNEKVNILDIEQKAKDYAEKHFDRDIYAKKIYEFFKEIVFQRPLHVVKDKCINIMTDMPTIADTSMPQRLANITNELYGFRTNANIIQKIVRRK